MSTVGTILKEKGTAVWTIAPNAPVYEALKIMAEKNVGCLLVMNGKEIAGIFSERDYARKGILWGRSSKDTSVDKIMTPVVQHIGPEASVEDCMALFTQKRIRHLPVVENGAVIGVISIGDVVKDVIAEQQRTIRDLGNYISGRQE